MKIDLPGENVGKIHDQGILLAQAVHGVEEAGRNFPRDFHPISIHRNFLFDGDPISPGIQRKLINIEGTGGIGKVQKRSLRAQADFERIAGLDPAEVDHRLQVPALGRAWARRAEDRVCPLVISPAMIRSEGGGGGDSIRAGTWGGSGEGV